jgi:ABC-type uncharacterized transport system permease subunit
MEIEITWANAIRVWWAYFWRNLIAIIVAIVAGGIVGAILGFVMGMLGVPVRTIQFITGPIGAVIGIALSVVPMKLILGKDFGTFRLVLISNAPTPQRSTGAGA